MCWLVLRHVGFIPLSPLLQLARRRLINRSIGANLQMKTNTMTPHHPSMSDEALSAAVACAYEGYTRRNAWSLWLDRGEERGVLAKPFATSADDALTLLEKAKHGWDSSWSEGQSDHGNYMVRYDGHIGRANTFARACCFALLRAAGQKVEES